ncbi:unnamed protein product [Darwinula stevensoni]|uniref:Uncharacterized protein n=1 Tax=Darwinula stevensoni TaxID=69355 RepID=A0A7R9A627_9CRUS|nr:unnamed protein product [Darwinula stevensoni]CAG0893266.1 unnamed protein product [Darwinula stevensoni]
MTTGSILLVRHKWTRRRANFHVADIGIAGVSRLFNSGIHRGRRLIWAVVLLASLALTIAQISDRLR